MSVRQIEDWRGPSCGTGCSRTLAVPVGRRQAEWFETHDLECRRRWAALNPVDAEVRTGPLAVDVPRWQARLDGELLWLSRLESRLLATLAGRVDRIVARDDLLEAVWGAAWRGDYHLLRVTVSRLRARLGAAHWLIEGHVGQGYRLRRLPPCALADLGPPPPRPISPRLSLHMRLLLGALSARVGQEVATRTLCDEMYGVGRAIYSGNVYGVARALVARGAPITVSCGRWQSRPYVPGWLRLDAPWSLEDAP